MAPQIAEFLQSVRQRLNQQLLCRSADMILPATMIIATCWVIGWRIFGYAAPLYGYCLIIASTLISIAIWFFWHKPNIVASARSADHHFHLKDALSSYLDFQQRDTSHLAFSLQEKSTLQRTQSCDVSTILAKLDRRRLGFSGALGLIVAILATLPHSAAVQEKLLAEQIMLDRTRTVEKEINEIVEELVKSMTDEEKELVKPEQLRQWAKEIGNTADREEAMKRMARFEQKVVTALAGLEARKDEEILKLAAAELAESQMADAKQLGKKLDAKDFEAAKQQLGELKPKEHKNLTPEELKRLQEQIAKLKEMSRRMAQGAKQRDFQSARPNSKNNKQRNPGDPMEMDEMLEQLDEAAQEIDPEDLEDLEEGGEIGELGEKMDQFGRRLGKADARMKMRGKLKALGKMAGKSQSFLNGQSQMLGLAQMAQPGGLKPGKGHLETKRDKNDEHKDNNNNDRLTGQKGDGPSRSSVEDAKSGSGISGRTSEEKQREYRRHAESLVQRDDVPEELKQGIREYFERVHDVPEESP